MPRQLTTEPAEPAAPSTPETRLTILGDSYMEGVGADSPDESLAQQVARGVKAKLKNLASGGTGYVNPGVEGMGREPYAARVEEVVRTDPDVVLVSGGNNDYGYIFDQDAASLEDERQAVADTLGGLVDELPEAEIVVSGPWWPTGTPVEGALQINSIIKEEAERLGLPFINPMGERWITGQPDESGNAQRFIGADRTHPTQAGHDYLAKRLLKQMKPALGG